MISDEHGGRTKQNVGHELEAKTLLEDFDISQEETGCPLLKQGNFASFAHINKLARLSYLRDATHTSSAILRNGFGVRQSAEVREMC